MSAAERPFSMTWVVLSMCVFVGTEIVLGIFVGELVVGRYLSIGTRFMMQGGLHLASFFVGGIVVGIVSPGVRTKEPALGAFFAVGLMLLVSLFTPYTFMAFSVSRLLIAGGIAYVLALSGARIGERWVGNKV